MTRRDFCTALSLLLMVVVASLYFWLDGTASNPLMILLVPVAAAMLLLPFGLAWMVVAGAVIGLLFQLQVELPAAMDVNSQYHASVLGQALALVLLGSTLHYLRLRTHRRNQVAHERHHDQYRHEHLVSIGTAAAQFSYEVATPIQTIQFMLEDVRQRYPNDEDLQLAEQQITRIHNLLTDWRMVAEDVRTRRLVPFNVSQLVQQLRSALLIARPDIHVRWQEDIDSNRCIPADRTLPSAILSLLHHAADAVSKSKTISISVVMEADTWVLRIVNQGLELAAEYQQRRAQVSTTTGHSLAGGGALTCATLERFLGQALWYRENGNTVTEVRLPTEACHD